MKHLNTGSLISISLIALFLSGCGEKSAYEEKAEQDAKARAEQNKAQHEKRE
jgi:PBP1b-binding outer membrane lipoprotein LpoB